MYADLQEVFAAYPALKQSYDTESKVIFGDDDWTKLASTLSDQQLIDDVLGQMTAQYASMTEDTESMINLVRVDFLKQAIKLQNNPARDHLLQRLALELERFPERDPDTHHADALSSIGYKHMIGDKIELIYVLKTYEHDFYAMLKEDSSEKLQSLIAYANEHEPALRKIAD